ncbi:purine-nucleoside phosphorylase [Desulfurobacterium atlanticum]|uniref:purine-nucleoside phosphorylase n=1 Tax=Desulfurobacterium atlanticum TaxID=240169 RepID=A0A239A7A5_9BACT|nr:purine-nucleoside phosphorylase [Desulfurobacterium atlanticum]SNR91556.1 purine-nucleoside phosphorylase [Desulfurobacterium atlanticum]
MELSAEFIKKAVGFSSFDIAVVLGSGVELPGKKVQTISYSDIPSFPSTQVEGHKGVFEAIELKGLKIAVFKGRFHYYEGRTDEEIRAIPLLSALLGCKLFVTTCAVGAVSRRAAAVDFVVIEDHINLQGKNPLVGLIKKYGSKVFVDLKGCYDNDFSDTFLKVALNKNVKVCKGVLAAMLGPSYETFAEIKMLNSMGVDVVSMSTVPEIIVARFLGMDVGAVAVVANDTMMENVNHDLVLTQVKKRNNLLAELLNETLIKL